MSLGLVIFTLVHVTLSLIGIVSGFAVAFGLIFTQRLNRWNALFLLSTVLTSVTGFLFPFHKFLPSHVLGILSLIVLALALVALYGRHLAGVWRRAYVVSSVIALYLNVFIFIAQLFQKVPALKVLAPTQSEAPLKLAQLSLLVFFIFLGFLATIKFRAERSINA